jgi:histidyl-tRNA synthetase
VEVFPEAKKVGQQLKYAESRGFRVALMAGTNEFAQGVFKMKDLAKPRVEGDQGTEVPEANLVEAVRAVLATG